MNSALTIVFWIVGIIFLLGILYLIGASVDQDKKEEENRIHEALADRYFQDIQVIQRPIVRPAKTEQQDPLVVFAYWVILPLFSACATMLVIMFVGMLLGK